MARIYVAGPMRGIPNKNAAKFKAVASMLRDRGHTVLDPYEIGLTHFQNAPGTTQQEYMEKNILELLTCDTICVLDGWRSSCGATLEGAIAKVLGYRFMNEQGHTIQPPEVIEIEQAYSPKEPG